MQDHLLGVCTLARNKGAAPSGSAQQSQETPPLCSNQQGHHLSLAANSVSTNLATLPDRGTASLGLEGSPTVRLRCSSLCWSRPALLHLDSHPVACYAGVFCEQG